jgi:hypothetical protein
MSWFTLSSKSSKLAVGKCCTNDSWGGWLYEEGNKEWLFKMKGSVANENELGNDISVVSPSPFAP